MITIEEIIKNNIRRNLPRPHVRTPLTRDINAAVRTIKNYFMQARKFNRDGTPFAITVDEFIRANNILNLWNLRSQQDAALIDTNNRVNDIFNSEAVQKFYNGCVKATKFYELVDGHTDSIPFVIPNVEIELPKSKVKMGDYVIHFRHDTTGIKICDNRTQKYSNSSFKYIHPHISIGGFPCLGNLEQPIQRLMQAGEITQTLRMLKDYLSSYNPDSVYHNINNFIKDNTYCLECGNLVKKCECSRLITVVPAQGVFDVQV